MNNQGQQLLFLVILEFFTALSIHFYDMLKDNISERSSCFVYLYLLPIINNGLQKCLDTMLSMPLPVLI